MIKIEIQDAEVRQALNELTQRVVDTTPVMRDIGQALLEGVRQRIAQGRDWQGRQFAPNSPVTLASKKGSKPLVDSGLMADEKLHYRAGRDYAEVGSSAVQAAVLHFGAQKGAFGRNRRGASIPWGNIPPRPFMPLADDGRSLPEAAKKTISDMLAGYLTDD